MLRTVRGVVDTRPELLRTAAQNKMHTGQDVLFQPRFFQKRDECVDIAAEPGRTEIFFKLDRSDLGHTRFAGDCHAHRFLQSSETDVRRTGSAVHLWQSSRAQHYGFFYVRVKLLTPLRGPEKRSTEQYSCVRCLSLADVEGCTSCGLRPRTVKSLASPCAPHQRS